MEQSHSVYMPGLTRRGPVFNSTYGFGAMPPRAFKTQPYNFGAILTPGMLGALPALSPMTKYGIMAALLYLGAKRKLPLGLMGGAAAAALVWQFFPNAASATAAAPVTVDTSGMVAIPPPDISNLPIPTVGIPAPNAPAQLYVN